MIPKFRAWHKKYEEMFPVNVINFIDGFVALGTSLALCETRIDDVVLMQSTGLFDSAGVEIFEGDCFNLMTSSIVDGRFKEFMAWVVFKGGCFRFSTNEKFSVEFVADNRIMHYPNLLVLGNIHEHSHLLE